MTKKFLSKKWRHTISRPALGRHWSPAHLQMAFKMADLFLIWRLKRLFYKVASKIAGFLKYNGLFLQYYIQNGGQLTVAQIAGN